MPSDKNAKGPVPIIYGVWWPQMMSGDCFADRFRHGFASCHMGGLPVDNMQVGDALCKLCNQQFDMFLWALIVSAKAINLFIRKVVRDGFFTHALVSWEKLYVKIHEKGEFTTREGSLACISCHRKIFAILWNAIFPNRKMIVEYPHEVLLRS